MEGEVRKLNGGGKEKVLFVFFCTGCGGSLYMPKHLKVCVMMFYFHCCSIIVGSLPFICTVKWHVCEPWIN